MLEHTHIAIGCLIEWLARIAGLSLIGISPVISDTLVRYGFAVLILGCGYSIRRSITAQNERLKEAFMLGREHERLSAVR